MKRLPVLLSLSLLLPAADLAAQGATFQVITPSPLSQAIGLSDDGDDVVGGVGADAFRWSPAGGYQVLPNGAAWAVTPDGSAIVGTTATASGDEAGRWTAATGWVSLGNFGGDPGCPPFISNLDDVTPDGQWATGMSWQGCTGTSAMRWNATTGLELLPKELANRSARAYTVSDDGQTAGGWHEASFGTRRGMLWLPGGGYSFILVTPANPDGIGEVTDLNSDGSIACGVTASSAFKWTAAGGVQLLPKIAGVGGTYTANGISEDGTVVVGVAAQFPNLTAWIWTAKGGTQTLLSYLQAKGATGMTAGMLRNCTDVSADGLAITGWGNSGAWFVKVASPWTDLGNGLAGSAGVPLLAGEGNLQPGSDLVLTLSGAAAAAPATLVAGFSLLGAPFKGGVLVPSPGLLLAGLATDAAGGLLLAGTWPAGVPSGLDLFFQAWVADAGASAGLAASNAVRAAVP